ncbi:MAG: hypothetical protein D3920_17335 [Candidatus Electrothrix sp. AW2]|nr:hypothetical protein [Candidatus Electrothrix gigas]
MKKLKAVVACVAAIQIVVLSHLAVGAPSGFVKIISKPGVKVYKKTYSGGKPDFVQVVDLSQGASLRLMRGNIANSGSGQGAYGGDNPSINRQSLSSAWNSFSSKEQHAVCITNGEFFGTKANPTTLAFPVVIDGEEIDGYGKNEYYNKNRPRKKPVNFSLQVM